jgi:hypothetical protein
LGSDADLKPLHVVFWWQAPAGTGKVTFKILIKQGEQNKGWFWYPAKRLTLTEGSVPQSSQYVLASTGNVRSYTYICIDTDIWYVCVNDNNNRSNM